MDATDPIADPAEFKLELFLPYRLSLLSNTVSQGISGGYRKEHGLTVTEWRVMAVLGRFPGLAAREVAERTAMDKVAISRAVKSLMGKGLLQRSTDHRDRRCRRLYLTRGKGMRLLAAILPKARQYEAKLLEVLTADEHSRLCDLIARLQGAAAAINRER